MKQNCIIKNHISYTAANKVAAICKPLFDSFKINYFDYGRIYFDDTWFFLATNRNWISHFVENKYPLGGKIVKSGIHLWNNYVPEQALKDLSRYFGFYNGITVYKQRDDFLEYFDFATFAESSAAIEFCLNHPDIMNKFLLYFKNTADELISLSYKSRFPVIDRKHNGGLANIKYEDFCDLIKVKNVKMNFGHEKISITKREYEVLLQIAKGKTTKEVAKTLNTSHRTIESQLMNIKNKCGFTFKSQLINMLRNNLYIMDIDDFDGLI